jgi:hypothetical protein
LIVQGGFCFLGFGGGCDQKGFCFGLESCWVGAGQYKILERREVGTKLKVHWMIWKSEFETYFVTG